MKLLAITPIAVTVELDATDCLVLADALTTSGYHDAYPDRSLVNALRVALEACAVLAAGAGTLPAPRFVPPVCCVAVVRYRALRDCAARSA